jgi:hypothetical protein
VSMRLRDVDEIADDDDTAACGAVGGVGVDVRGIGASVRGSASASSFNAACVHVCASVIAHTHTHTHTTNLILTNNDDIIVHHDSALSQKRLPHLRFRKVRLQPRAYATRSV